MKQSLEVRIANLSGYKLLDSGDKQKLESMNGTVIIRSEPRAWWEKSLPESEWAKAMTIEDTVLEVEGLRIKIKSTAGSKHIGIFPEQSSQWQWILEMISKRKQSGKEVNVLNLFGYTGVSTLAATKAGASVTHVDGSRTTIGWAQENQKLSQLDEAPIRWILDDALDYVKREVKRGVKYDAIIMDPPSYGKGPKGQVWKAEDNLTELLKLCREALSDDPLFVILNMYSTDLSSLSLQNLLADMTSGLGGELTAGELTIAEESSDRLLPLSIFASWSK